MSIKQVVLNIVLPSVIVALLCCAPATAWAVDNAKVELSQRPVSVYQDYDINKIPVLSANFFACMDEDGNVYASYHGSDRVKIASVTKIMTALVAADYPMDKKMLVTEFSASIPGSAAGVEVGDEIELYELLEGLMLPSGNDAAYVIAENIGNDLLVADGQPTDVGGQVKVDRFVEQMNRKAQELGMEDSLFANPCGLDDEGFEGPHVSSAIDVAKMTRAAMDIPAVAAVCGEFEAQMMSMRQGNEVLTPLSNTNWLLNEKETVIGTKTGYTDAAGGCFSGTCLIGQDKYYVTVLGCASTSQAISEAESLFEWTADSRKHEVVVPYGGMDVAVLAVPQWATKTITARVDEGVEMNYWEWEGPYAVNIDSDIPERGNIVSGDKIGKLQLLEWSGEVVKEYPTFAVQSVPAPSICQMTASAISKAYIKTTGDGEVVKDVYAKLVPAISNTYAL